MPVLAGENLMQEVADIDRACELEELKQVDLDIAKRNEERSTSRRQHTPKHSQRNVFQEAMPHKTINEDVGEPRRVAHSSFKPQPTPRAESSILAQMKFKRRSRQPSIVGIGRDDEDETLSVLSDLTGLDIYGSLNKAAGNARLRLSGGRAFDEENERTVEPTPQGRKIHSAREPSLDFEWNFMKRSLRPLPGDAAPPVSQSPKSSANEKSPASEKSKGTATARSLTSKRSHSEIEEEDNSNQTFHTCENEEPELPSAKRRAPSISSPDDEMFALPESSSTPRSPVVYPTIVDTIEERSGNLVSAKRRKGTNTNTNLSKTNKPKIKATGARKQPARAATSKTQVKNTEPKPVSTAALKVAMPQRRTRARTTTIDIATDSEADELSYTTSAPKSKTSIKAKPKKNARKTTSRITQPKSRQPRKTSHRLSASDKENLLSESEDSRIEGTFERVTTPVPKTVKEMKDALQTSAEKAKNVELEIEKAKKKFMAVDDWEMEFEEETVG